MINILPPELRSQINYSKRNTQLLKYLFNGLIVLMVLGGLLGGSFWYANRQINHYQQTLAARQSERGGYQEIEAKVATLQSSLSLIDKLLTEKTRYSALLADLAATLPPSAYIIHLSLSGDEKDPLEMQVNVDSFNRAAELKNGLIQSRRIKSADIQSISRDDEGSGYNVVIVAAFEPGQAR